MFQCLLVQKVLLFVLDLLSVVQGCVHVSIAVCIRDSLHSSGCSLSERYGCVHAVDDAELILLSDLFAFVQLFLALLAFLFFIVRTLLEILLDEPETEACERGRNAGGHDNCCHVNWFLPPSWYIQIRAFAARILSCWYKISHALAAGAEAPAAFCAWLVCSSAGVIRIPVLALEPLALSLRR